MTTYEQAVSICDEWVAKLGLGFHPDTKGKDYRPFMLEDEIVEYDEDMDALFSLDVDPYQAAIDAWQRAKLINE